jgi:hypothetical protein
MRQGFCILKLKMIKSREQYKLLIWAVSWLRRLVAGLSPRRPGFTPAHVGFVVDKVVLGQVSSEFFGFPTYHSSMARHTQYIIWGVNNRPIGGRCSEIHNLTPST